MASQLLDTMNKTLFVNQNMDENRRNIGNLTELSVNASLHKLQISQIFFHLLAKISRQAPTVSDLLKSGKADDEGLKFMVNKQKIK